MTNLALTAHLNSLASQNIDSDMVAGAQKLLARQESVVNDAVAKVKAIQASDALTAKGKFEQSQKIALDAKTTLEAAHREADGYRQHIAQLEGQLRVRPSSKEDALVQYLRDREIRDYYRQKDPVVVQGTYQSAIAGGHDELAAALENAPPGAELLKPDVKAQGLAARAERQNPEVAAKLKSLRTVLDAVDYVHKDFLRSLETETGITFPKDIVIGK